MLDDQVQRRTGALEERLIRLHDAAKHCIKLASANHAAELGRVLRLDADIGVWEKAIDGRPEHLILADARRELGFTVYAASSGLYLQAYSNLRVFLELSFAAIEFSIDDLRRRQWLADATQFSFSGRLNPDDGFFSKAFLQAYRPDATSEATEFRALAARSYHHCSQFVHGKMTFTNRLPETLEYSANALTDWAGTARDAARDDGRLADTLAHSFGRLWSVRKAIGLPIGDRTPHDSD